MGLVQALSSLSCLVQTRMCDLGFTTAAWCGNKAAALSGFPNAPCACRVATWALKGWDTHYNSTQSLGLKCWMHRCSGSELSKASKPCMFRAEVNVGSQVLEAKAAIYSVHMYRMCVCVYTCVCIHIRGHAGFMSPTQDSVGPCWTWTLHTKPATYDKLILGVT